MREANLGVSMTDFDAGTSGARLVEAGSRHVSVMEFCS